MTQFGKFVALAVALLPLAAAFPVDNIVDFPAHASLGGLSEEQLAKILPRLTVAPPENPPPPLADTSAKLVNDAAHPFRAPRPGDIRGPCPGMNTLASHGYLPRNGVVTPGQVITAVMEGFNMNYSIASFTAYAAFLTDGNPLTNLMSIGGKTKLTGKDPVGGGIIGGLNTHSVFEGDASTTRADAFFGDNHSFNLTLWNEFVDFSNRFGGGKYNLTVAAELRHQRILDSIATNPTFELVSPRYFTAFAESSFVLEFFIDGRQKELEVDLDVALGFFRDMKFPKDFWRPPFPRASTYVQKIHDMRPIPPGANKGAINTYTPDAVQTGIPTFCQVYGDFVRITAGLYPNPKGVLKQALNRNLGFLYNLVRDDPTCPQIFPFGH